MKIFLDIDGVMVHANPTKMVEFDADGFYKFNISAITALQSIFTHYNSNEIILSTSHRFRYSIDEWKIIFLNRGIDIKKISRIEISLEDRQSRKTEILNWIKTKHIRTKDILIIDDDKSLNGLPIHLKNRLFLTNPYTGLDINILSHFYCSTYNSCNLKQIKNHKKASK